tara:strand:+ start:218 stop:502 length:285 start_codon:yes stop_codon:yes gene_type:complete
MKTKKKLSTEYLRLEGHRVTTFVIMAMDSAPEHRALMADIFEAYKSWLKRHELPATKLNLDGFGRLFPKDIWPRKAIRLNGTLGKGIVGAKPFA